MSKEAQKALILQQDCEEAKEQEEGEEEEDLKEE